MVGVVSMNMNVTVFPQITTVIDLLALEINDGYCCLLKLLRCIWCGRAAKEVFGAGLHDVRGASMLESTSFVQFKVEV
jgi:hypothetical protein